MFVRITRQHLHVKKLPKKKKGKKETEGKMPIRFVSNEGQNMR